MTTIRERDAATWPSMVQPDPEPPNAEGDRRILLAALDALVEAAEAYIEATNVCQNVNYGRLALRDAIAAAKEATDE